MSRVLRFTEPSETSLHAVRTQFKVFVRPQVRGPHFQAPLCGEYKPVRVCTHMGYGLWAHEDASGEDDDDRNFVLVQFVVLTRWVSAANVHAVHSCPDAMVLSALCQLLHWKAERFLAGRCGSEGEVAKLLYIAANFQWDVCFVAPPRRCGCTS